ncbi:hypothetical protein AB205_0069020 [Aquarana catesbeiana]|uniref:Uncharacterized protein n=1 Tax=Aquarana catesbeiana TaxID=8400 RepID=A0A2G9PUU9_AQUCT|nr:hypothetical protein AB205_0069020 [Aquarana catesbeiana]
MFSTQQCNVWLLSMLNSNFCSKVVFTVTMGVIY